MGDWLTSDFFSIIAAAFVVGTIVGLTGMGGGALMTPALIFLGVGGASTVVTADLTAAAIYKTGGAITHAREGKPNWVLARWLILGSVPFALLGPWLLHHSVGDSGDLDTQLKKYIGFALLLAAATYALRLVINLRRVRGGGPEADPDPGIRPLITVAVGALGGLLVGVTSVGSGSVIMISLVMLYPGLSALRLVGTDLVQAVPLVLAAAISNIALNGLDWHILVPLVIGSTPGTDPRQPDRAAGAAVLHPPRHRGRADDVRPRPARQGRLGTARLGRRPDPPRAHRPGRRRHDRRDAVRLGPGPPDPGHADVRLTHGRRARGRPARRHRGCSPGQATVLADDQAKLP